MTDNTTPNTNQQQNTPPEGNGSAGKMFTQEEVNKIVQERLARERAKATDDATLTARENELKAREEAFNARLEKANLKAKTDAFKAILSEVGVYGPRIDPITEDSKKAAAFIESMEIDETGDIKNRSGLLTRAKAEFSEYIATTIVKGAPVEHPLENTSSSPTATLLKRAFGLTD